MAARYYSPADLPAGDAAPVSSRVAASRALAQREYSAIASRLRIQPPYPGSTCSSFTGSPEDIAAANAARINLMACSYESWAGLNGAACPVSA